MPVMNSYRNRTVIVLFVAFLATLVSPLGAIAAEPQVAEKKPSAGFEVLKPPKVAVGALAGSHFDPLNAAFALHLDVYFSRYLSMGPNFQLGFNDSRGFFTGTIGGKFHMPMEWISKQYVPELTYQTAVGYFLKRDAGVNFSNFVVETGPGLSVLLHTNWAFQTVFLLNVTNDDAERYFTSLLGGFKYLF